MEFEIQLWLRGYLFTSGIVSVPDFDDRMSHQKNQEYRESLVKSECLKMKAIYSRQIDKCEGKYTMYIQLPSKMRFIPVDEGDEIITSKIDNDE